jgi:molybdopterin converting factor small subunit
VIVTVRFFSAHKSLAGEDELSVELRTGATVGDLIQALRERLGGFPDASRITPLVNHRAATGETTLADGDRVLILQILGGG